MLTIKNTFSQASLATRLIFFAFGLGISSWAPMVPFVKMKLGVDDGELGLILFIFGIGALVSMPLTGFFVHRFGSRLISFISALFVVVTLPFLTLFDTVFSVASVLFVFGMCTGAWNVAINAQAVTVELKSPKPIMSGFHCLFSLGGLSGALIVGGLLEFGLSLFFCALMVSSIMLVIVVWQWKSLLEDGQSQQQNKDPVTFSFPNIKVVFLGIICFIAFMAEGSMLDWSAEFLRSSLEYNPATAGMGFAVFSVAMSLGRFFGDRIIQKLGTFVVFLMGSLIASCGFFLIVCLGWIHLELLGFLLIGLGASNIVPILFSMSGRIEGTSSSYALTVITTCGYVGMLIGPALIGFIAQATTLSIAFICIAFLLLMVSFSSRYVFTPQLLPQKL